MSAPHNLFLPLQPQRELELSGFGGGGGLSCLRVERIHVGDVEAVGDVEHIGNAFQFETFSERNFSRYA